MAAWRQLVMEADFGRRTKHTLVNYNNRAVMIAGLEEDTNSNSVWHSMDGINWKNNVINADFAPRSRHCSCVYDERVWVIGGVSGSGRGSVTERDVWSSEDARKWRRVTDNHDMSGRYDSQVVADTDRNRMVLIGGYDSQPRNDVWWSVNGRKWNKLRNASPLFSGRYGHRVLHYMGKIWVIGGYDEHGNFKNDVWYSSDGGQKWQYATQAASFPARYGFGAAVYDQRMWVAGGYNTTDGYLNDVWYSRDGRTWTQSYTAEWPARERGTMFELNGRLMIAGGDHGLSLATEEADCWELIRG